MKKQQLAFFDWNGKYNGQIHFADCGRGFYGLADRCPRWSARVLRSVWEEKSKRLFNINR